MKFGVRGQLTDIITCVKFLVDRLSGYGVLTPPKLPFPIDLLRRPYNSVRTNVLHCDLFESGANMIKAVNVSLPIFVACLLVFIYSLFFTRR